MKEKGFEVMIVDDDEIVVFLHKIILKETGLSHSPITASCGTVALDHIMNCGSDEMNYLVLLDINMPGMNAWEFLYELEEKSLSHRIHVAIVSSSIDSRDKIITSAFNNIVDFIEKPLLPKDCERLKQIEVLERYF